VNKVLVVLPTYNEIENLERVAKGIRATGSDILIVDDGSPDGTGELADRLAQADPGISVIHRPHKLGLGSAYIAGFTLGLERGYNLLVEMDADGSHLPEHLPAIVEAAERGGGIGLGSRYVPGGSVSGWQWPRLVLSRGANLYCRAVLWLSVRDATSGFRCYTRKVLEAIDLQGLISEGYSFQVEMVYQAVCRGFQVVEVPIHFEDRVAGKSKVSEDEVTKALLNVLRMRVRGRSE
jgi:glycosyltransferase involved in cell wall biosynthesis